MVNVSYGSQVAGEADLRLCGDVSGKRVIELGIGPVPNAVALAQAGAKTIVLDPSPDRIATLRRQAEQAEVRVECHEGELADLGFVTSASVDLVVASHTLGTVDDLPRLLRQVHRVLRPETSFVVALFHPVAAMFDNGTTAAQRRYGTQGMRSFGELFMSFERSNMRIDVVHELFALTANDAIAPTVLVLRARKQGV